MFADERNFDQVLKVCKYTYPLRWYFLYDMTPGPKHVGYNDERIRNTKRL